MTQRLTVHVGVNKTGSSAIQAFLKLNWERLRVQGVLVPDEDLEDSPYIAGHHIWYFDRHDGTVPERTADLTSKVERMFSRHETKQIVISAENLSDADSDTARWFTEVAQRYDVEIVAYLRRQDEFLLSAWQQWFVKVYPDFWTWLVSCVGVLADWRVALERWERIVGRERIRVRLFGPEKLLNGDVVADFGQFLLAEPIAVDGACMQPVNSSFTEAIADLTRGSTLFETGHDNAFYEFVDEMLGPSSHRRGDESIITFEQRKAILDRYAQSNAWVREHYFDNTDFPEGLFKTPSPADYAVHRREDLMREQIQVLARLIFELSKRHSGE